MWSYIESKWRRFTTVDHGVEPLSVELSRETRLRARGLARSRILDLEFYESQTGMHFGSRRRAAEHFLDRGLSAGLSISPFFQEEWYRYQTGGQGCGYETFLFGNDGLSATAPTFDATVFAAHLSATGVRAPATARAALELFLKKSTDTTRLPVHEWCAGNPTKGQARAAAMAKAHANRTRERLIRPRLSSNPITETFPEDDQLRSDSLVSVVLPVRNRAALVPTAIRSVLAQSHQAWELIVVDDGSDDDTADVVAHFVTLDPRIRLIRQAATGVCAARNAGLWQATGSYVAFIDSDNAWMPEILSRSARSLDSSSAVAVYSAVRLIDEHERVQYLAFRGDRDDLIQGGNFVDLNTLVSRREALQRIDGFDESLRRWVDYDLVIRLFDIGTAEYLDFIGVAYSENKVSTRISTTEAPGWEQVVLAKYLIDWDAVTESASRRPADLVSIVMLTYADWRMTLEGVQAVLANTEMSSVEIIVVDNGSPASVADILSQGLSGNDRVRLTHLNRNMNFALGSNLGFALSRGSRVVFLNDDAQVQPGWLPPLVQALDAAENVRAVQSVIINADGETENTGLSVSNGRASVRTELTSSTHIDAVSAVAAMFRASDFARCRGFDPIFSNGSEDADLCLRLAKSMDAVFSVAPSSRVTHFGVFSPGRFAATPGNERIFQERWGAATESEKSDPANAESLGRDHLDAADTPSSG